MPEGRNDICRRYFSYFSRFVALLTAALAAASVRQVRKMLEEESWYEDGTVTAAILVCMPEEMTVLGSSISFSADSDNATKCRGLDFLIHSAACALVLACIAIVSFAIIEFMAERGRGPFNKSSAMGMGFFSTFITLQAGFSTGALMREAKFWEDNYQHMLDAFNKAGGWYVQLKSGDTVKVNDIVIQGNQNLIAATVWFLFLTTLITTVEVLIRGCWVPDPEGGGLPQRKSVEEHGTSASTLEVNQASSSFNGKEEPGAGSSQLSTAAENGQSEVGKPSWLTLGNTA